MEGRWTLLLCKDCGQRAHYQNRCPVDRRRVWTEMVEMPVVPCDDAAVERAAEALYELSRGQPWPGVLGGIATSHVGFQTVAEAVLRAAGESGPDPSKSGSPEQAERGAAGPPNPKPEGGES